MWNEFRKKRKVGTVSWVMRPPDKYKVKEYAMGLKM